jgi:hypothetical protein
LLGYHTREVEREFDAVEAELESTRAELDRAREARPKWRAALATRNRRIWELNGVARYLSRMVVERDRELRGLRAELAAVGPGDAVIEAMRVRDEESARALERLQGQIADIGAQARGQATRIRMQALRQAVQLAAKENGGSGVGGSENGGQGGGAGAIGVGSIASDAAACGIGAVDTFEGIVHMEVGPLRDFSQLVSFEDAVTGIGAATEISVQRFSKGRATLALRFDRPVELLRELEARTPFEIRVRSLKDDRLIVDVEEQAAA